MQRESVCVVFDESNEELHRWRWHRLSDTMGDVNAEVERLGYDLSAGRLCRFGGASLPPDVFLTVAESGLRANSSLQVLGRLRGGDEVTAWQRRLG